ncbi:hypothetical protein B0H17DRAFT_1208257 [Mycena rosella]|uniref:Uncharacterized protein n=1 Tax=Mycena rosella TaxID=1033263 RepID=A0AAD7D4Z9_MYCRO|nr:hypothetical protein B0H17DRAFT_1208257 [Mycena rosella]
MHMASSPPLVWQCRCAGSVLLLPSSSETVIAAFRIAAPRLPRRAVTTPSSTSSTAAALANANTGFDHLFANQTPFHLLGLVCAFLEAALGMESGLMGEAGARKATANAKRTTSKIAGSDGGGRFAAGLEWEILNADTVVLLGLTHALSESFTKLWKAVFPRGLEGYATPAVSRRESVERLAGGVQGLSVDSLSVASSRNASSATLSTSTSTSSSLALSSTACSPAPSISVSKSVFGRWRNASSVSVLSKADKERADAREKYERERAPEGPVEEMIVAQTAFGFGLFNFVFSLFPKKVQSLVGLPGFKYDRALALRTLAVSAGGDDRGRRLVLMTFHGVVLLLAGYQADEARTLKMHRAIVDSIEARYPTRALWILNRAKILRMSNNAAGVITVLQRGLEGPQTFDSDDGQDDVMSGEEQDGKARFAAAYNVEMGEIFGDGNDSDGFE